MLKSFLDGFLSVWLVFFKSALFPYFLIGIAAGFLVMWKLPVIKGALGEWRVNRILRGLGEKYIVYQDLYIPNGERGMTQIDHLVVSPYGLFVIETKNYKGWIFGNEKQMYWTQVIYKRKEKFYNPIRQNYGHLRALGDHLSLERELFFSVIAFSRQATLKFERDFTGVTVVYFDQLPAVIKKQQTRKFGEETLDKIRMDLEELVIRDRKKKRQISREHLEAVKEKKKQQIDAGSGTCPKCGGKLSQKTGKYGLFYGCSDFPRCRYTEKGA